MHRLFLLAALVFAAPAALAQAPEPEPLPLLAEPGGAEALATLVDVPWEELGDGEARDFPALSAHWGRVSTAFFAYSTAMAQGQPVMREWSVVAPRMLKLGGMLAASGDALIAALPEGDTTRARRAEGLDQVRGGLHKMGQGALMVLVEMPAEVRQPYVRDLAEALPGVLAAVDPADALVLRAQARGAGALLPEAEASLLDTAAGEMPDTPPSPPMVDGAPDRLLLAQTAAGWPGEMPEAWREALLATAWERHPGDAEAHKADAYALLVGAHAWHQALAEGRVDGLETVAPLVDAALRAGASALAAELELADPAVFREALGELVVRATAVAAHHSARDREPLALVLAARLPGLLGAMPSAEAEALRTQLRAVADRKLERQLGL